MRQEREKIYLTDGEGPVVFKDLARDISLKRLPSGQFDITSLWVAYDTEKKASIFKPGDTLALIVPHLITHGVTDEDLYAESTNVVVANGIVEHLEQLRSEGWKIGIISTAYEHLWEVCSPRLNIQPMEVTSTRISLANIGSRYMQGLAKNAILQAEEALGECRSAVNSAILDFQNGVPLRDIFQQPAIESVNDALSELYFSRLPQLGFHATSVTEVMGGSSKANRIQIIADELQVDLSEVVYVGDSITDDSALKFIREGGGLSIAVNGDEYAIRNANVAIGTTDMREIKKIIDAWTTNGIDGVRALAEGQMSGGHERDFCQERRQSSVDIVYPECVNSITEAHRKFRLEIRGNASPLI